MNTEEIDKILENHQHWLKQDVEGWEKMRADFRNADLRCADLKEVNLKGADFRGAELKRVNLRGANLEGVDFRNACLSGADLMLVNLKGANLSWTDLCTANLYKANLSCANLEGADLRWANFREADLEEADLHFADLYGANLEGNDLKNAKNVSFIPIACPDTGSFIGFKKAEDCLVKLRIPEDATRFSATGRKCRCNKAEVLEITSLVDGSKVESVCSDYDSNFIYTVGKTVKVDNFDPNRFNECSTGIHFFINRQEAIDYIH